MTNITPVIFCGGSGTRLWPLSRTGFPKQFLCLTGEESLFQQAARRLMDLGRHCESPATNRHCEGPPGPRQSAHGGSPRGLSAARDDGLEGGPHNDLAVSPPLIVTGEEHRFLASEQLREAGIAMGAALLEPVGRNTAPALTLAALAAMENGGDPVLVVTPADQTVSDTVAFTAAMQSAVREAERGTIVILGVTPDAPETGYGYIHVALSSRRKRVLVGRSNRSAARAASAKTNHCSAKLRSEVWIATPATRSRNDDANATVPTHLRNDELIINAFSLTENIEVSTNG